MTPDEFAAKYPMPSGEETGNLYVAIFNALCSRPEFPDILLSSRMRLALRLTDAMDQFVRDLEGVTGQEIKPREARHPTSKIVAR